MIEQSQGGLLAFVDRRTVEKLLDARLPANVKNIRYIRWQPSGDLAYFEALISWESSKQDYLSFAQARGLTPFSTSGPNVHLPIDWRGSSEIPEADWWNPSDETPEDANSGAIGTFGSIKVKWEAGRVYGIVTDTGHRGAVPTGLRE